MSVLLHLPLRSRHTERGSQNEEVVHWQRDTAVALTSRCLVSVCSEGINIEQLHEQFLWPPLDHAEEVYCSYAAQQFPPIRPDHTTSHSYTAR
jgi:hypothetical protein